AEGVRFQRNAHFQHPVSSRWSHQRAVPARTTRPAAPEECTTGLALDPNRRGSTDTMDTAIPRRRFLQGTAALTLAAGLPAPSRADEPGNMPIVDTHQHLWDLSRFKLPGLKGVPKLQRSFLMEDYTQAIKGLNVVKSVYMEVGVEPSQQAAEAEYVLDLIRL